MKTRRHHNTVGYQQVQRGKTWEQVRAMAKRLGLPFVGREVPFGPDIATLPLKTGLYLIEVMPERTLWIQIPNEPEDKALSLPQAVDELMKPALAALRAHQTEHAHEADRAARGPAADRE